MLSFASFIKLLKESFRDLLPIVLVILFFQLAIIEAVPEGWMSTALGLGIVGVGLAIFLLGLEVGIFPIGEGLARDFAHKGSKRWIVVFAFLIGFGTTIAEPALFVIAEKAAAISSGRIDATILRLVVAFSVGFAIVLGVVRILLGHPIHFYIIAGYILVVGTTFYSPHEIVGLAYDLGGVTTSTVTVPLVAALGIGLATTIKGRSPVLDGFGLIAFASLTPMIFVQLYGLVVYELVDVSSVALVSATSAENSSGFDFSIIGIITGIFSVVMDVLPILLVILFFQYVVIKKHIDNLKEVIIGFGLVIVGLYAFIMGLEMGLFSLGETMANQLTQGDSNVIIYIFGFAIGFSTTMAEPALMAIAKKAKEISDGKINDFALRLYVAFGVAVGIALGAFRIIDGGHIVYYIIAGYAFVITLTSFAPKYIIPIAFDSGGVTTSTVTVPLVAAIGLGLATNIDGRDPLIDGFGLVAFASLFPMITVMLYGIIAEQMGIKGRHELEVEHILELQEALADADNMRLATISVDGKRHSYKQQFSAVHIVIPHNKKEQALKASKEAGATGVTIMEAHGMGVDEIDSFYNRLEHEATDLNLMFIFPTKRVDKVISTVMKELDIVGEGEGIVFSYPITHMKGLSLKSEHI